MANGYTYTRVCFICKSEAIVTYKPKPHTLCTKCSGLKLAKGLAKVNTKTEHKRYYYFCPNCPSVRVLKVKRKSPYCNACSKQVVGKSNKGKERQLRYFRLCMECPEDDNIIQVSSAKWGGIRLCPKHARKAKSPKKRFVPKKEKIVQREIERNRKHYKAEDDKARQVIPEPSKSYEEMMAEYLKDNPITVIENTPRSDLMRERF